MMFYIRAISVQLSTMGLLALTLIKICFSFTAFVSLSTNTAIAYNSINRFDYYLTSWTQSSIFQHLSSGIYLPTYVFQLQCFILAQEHKQMTFMQELLKQNIPIWQKCAATPFVRELQNGTLPPEKFKQYLIQDSIYLKHYARAYAQAMYCSTVLKDIQLYYSVLSFITDTESAVRLNYLAQFGLTDDDIEQLAPLPENQNYIDFLLATASQGNICEILMAVLPCVLSYSYIFRMIANEPGTADTKYFDFIEDYAKPQYAENCKQWCDFTDKKCAALPATEKAKLSAIFKKASLLELDFWKMAYQTPCENK